MKNFRLWFIFGGIAIILGSIWVLWETPFLPETKKTETEEVKTNNLPGQYREGKVTNLIQNDNCEFFVERRNIKNENFYNDVYQFNVGDSVIEFSLLRRDRVAFAIFGRTTVRNISDGLCSVYGVVPNHFFQTEDELIHLLASGFYGHHYIFNSSEEELQHKKINYAFSKAKINYAGKYYIALEEKSQGYVYDHFLFAGIYEIPSGVIYNCQESRNGTVDSLWIMNGYLFMRHDNKHYNVKKNVDESKNDYTYSKMDMETGEFSPYVIKQ